MKRISGLFAVLCLSLAAFGQQSVNNAQVSGTVISTGNGTTNAGSQRVTIASDNTAFAVNATLSAETTKVIGVVRNADGAGNLLTTNSTTFTAKFAQDTNLLGTLGTAFTTAGLVDVKGADGNVFIRQTTASNLKVAMSGNAGAIMDFVGQNAAQPANALLMGGEFNTSPTTITTGNASPLQLDSSGKLLVNCTGCSAGSTVALIPTTTANGMVTKHLVLAATTNLTAIKGTSGNLYGINVYNNTSYPFYVKFYNVASGSVAVGTTTIAYEVAVQAGTEREVHTDAGIGFSNAGWSFAVTKGIADSDTTSVALNDGVVDLLYE